MRVLVAVLLLVASLMAGCTGSDDEGPVTRPPTSTPPSPGGVPVSTPPPEPVTERRLMTDFEFAGCSGLRYETPIGRDAAAGLLPEGYTPRVDSGALPAEPAAQAQLMVDMYNCTSFTAGSYAFEQVWVGLVRLPVEAPADAVAAGRHAYIVQMVGGEDVMTAIWKVVGFPTHNGTTSREDLPAATTMSAGEYRLDVSQGTPTGTGLSDTFAWYHELENGDRVTWTGTMDIPAGGLGGASLTYPEDAPFASVAPVPGQPLSGQGQMVDDASFTSQNMVQELAEYRE